MITLYGFALSNYYNKVKIVLLEKGIAFEEQRVHPTQPDAAMLERSPAGKVPYIVADGVSLCESQVICDYLEARYPQPALVPADPMAAAKVRELCQFLDLHVELVGRELYGAAYFGGTISDSAKERVRKHLTRNLVALKRLIKLSPYAAGDTFSVADACAFGALPAVAGACKAVYGEDLVASAGIDWKSHLKLLSERPSVQRVNEDRKNDMAQTAAAKAAATAR
jgi:glutathione S-transferase